MKYATIAAGLVGILAPFACPEAVTSLKIVSAVGGTVIAAAAAILEK